MQENVLFCVKFVGENDFNAHTQHTRRRISYVLNVTFDIKTKEIRYVCR